MPKEECEFIDPDELSWVPIEAGSGAVAEGMVQKILSFDKETGDSGCRNRRSNHPRLL
jgi:hypothetical protein